MTRLVALLLIILYLPASLNAMVTAHYCMGKLTGVDLITSSPAGNTCSQCSMVKKDQKGCCHDKQETLKLNKDQLSSSSAIIAAPFTGVVQSQYFSVPAAFFALCEMGFSNAHSPPLIRVSPLLLYCVFRI